MSEMLKVTSPYDGHLVSELAFETKEYLEESLATAYSLANDKDAIIPLPERIAILEKCAGIVEKNSEEYAKQASAEGGKPLVDSRIELARAVQGIRSAASSLAELKGKEIPMGLTASSLNRRAFTIREPIGVVAAVSAFNHPFNLTVHQVIPAVAVGCPVIVKPASSTPLSCINLVEALHLAGLPDEWCKVLISGRDLGEKLVTDKRISFFSFIGSSKVGWSLKSKLAPGVHCALEHGGSAPVIVEADADLDTALPLLTKGGFYHAGQVCVSVQRVFVHESIVDDFAKRLTQSAEKLIVGDPLDEKTEVGPLITTGDVDRVDEWVNDAKDGGGKILCGGKKLSDTTYAPTVILNPTDDATVSQKEIFGPVVCIYSYSDRLDAIKRANDVPFSFQGAVFTKDLDVAFDTVNRLSAVAVMVNDHTAFRVDWMPFGGRKESGIGVGGILPAMEEMTVEKLVVIKSPSF